MQYMTKRADDVCSAAEQHQLVYGIQFPVSHGYALAALAVPVVS